MSEYNIFISHAWKYSKHYKRVEDWICEAQNENELTWNNCSACEEKPLVELNSKAGKAKLQEEITEQIKASGIVIILSGMYTKHSEWLGYEIDSALENGKYIIAVEPWAPGKAAKKIAENANVMVAWDKKAIIDAIKNAK